jgi:ArsR family metal-binding transcriptional regulator
MPLYPNAKDLIRKNLEALQAGQRIPRVSVGKLTRTQIEAINARQAAEDLPPSIDEVFSLTAISIKGGFWRRVIGLMMSLTS